MNFKINDHFKKITIPVHILGVLSLFVVSYSINSLIWILILWMLFGGYGIAVGYHRYFSHKSFNTYPIISNILSIFGLMSMAGSTIFWVSYHRGIHHKYADTDRDLHSPVRGFFKSFILWQNDITDQTVNPMYSKDLMRDKFLVWQHKYQNKIFWFIITTTFIISWEFALGVLIPACILSHHQDNLINVFGHTRSVGYRNFNTKDNSVNEFFTGLFFWGQGWHNNHHAYPLKRNYGGIRWWEFDSAHYVLIPIIDKNLHQKIKNSIKPVRP